MTKYVRVVVGRLTSFVDEKVYNEVFHSSDLNVIEEMTECWKIMTSSRVFRVEVGEETSYEVYDDDNNKLEFDY